MTQQLSSAMYIKKVESNPLVFAEEYTVAKVTEKSCHMRIIINKTLAAILSLLPSNSEWLKSNQEFNPCSNKYASPTL